MAKSVLQKDNLKFLDDSSNELFKMTAGTDGLTLSGNTRIMNVGQPTHNNDAVTKTYVDSLLKGLSWRPAVRVASTEEIQITPSSLLPGTVLDGVTLQQDDRILLYHQSDKTKNLIYKCDSFQTVPTLETIASGSTVFVQEGAVNANLTFSVISEDETEHEWAVISATQTMTAGNGLVVNQNALDVNVDDVTLEVVNDVVKIKDGGIPASALDPNGITTATVSLGHGFDQNASTTGPITHNDNALNLQLHVDGSTVDVSSSNGIHVMDSGITNPKLATDAVTNSKIQDDAVSNMKLQDDCVDSRVLALSSVGNGHLKNNAVTTGKILDDTISTAKLKDGCIENAKLGDYSISNLKLQADCVKNRAIATDAVQTDNIMDANVTTAKLEDEAVTTAKLADGSITFSKLTNSTNRVTYIAGDGIQDAGTCIIGSSKTINVDNTVMRKTALNEVVVTHTYTQPQNFTHNENSTSTATGSVRVTGGIGVGGNITSGGAVSAIQFNATSDMRKKTNIESIDKARAQKVINKLNPCSFHWKDGGAKSNGLMAQELRDVVPSAVHEDSQGNLSVDYMQLLAFVIACLKE